MPYFLANSCSIYGLSRLITVQPCDRIQYQFNSIPQLLLYLILTILRMHRDNKQKQCRAKPLTQLRLRVCFKDMLAVVVR